jgi:hypothetical protein
VHRSPADAVAFFAPGLVHQFGNLLLTIQGHALGLPASRSEAERAEPPGRARDAILTAAERGGRSLQLLRRLLGEPEGAPADACELLTELVEIARVPVREARQLLEWSSAGVVRGSLWVDASACAQLFGAALLGLLRAVPDGARGTVRVGLRGDGAAVAVRLAFAPQAGSLPFPLPTAAAVAELEAFAAGQGHAAACIATANGIELRLPARSASAGFDPRLGLAES